MKTLITFFLVIIFSIAQGQTTTATFQKIFYADSNTIINEITPLAGGGYIACGSTISHDHLIIKMNANGQTIWSKSIGTAANEMAYRVGEVNGGSGYYLLGTGANMNTTDINFIKVDLSGNILWNKNYTDSFTWMQTPSLRQMPNGDFIISATYVNVNNDFYAFIKTDSNGNVIWSNKVAEMWGEKFSCYDIDINQGNTAYTAVGNSGLTNGIFAASCDVSGNLLWAKTYTDINSNTLPGYAITKTTDGGYAMSSSLGDNGFPALIKIDGSGNVLWAKSYVNQAAVNPYGSFSVRQTTDNGFILAGLDSSNYPLLIKTNSSGHFQWAKYYTLSVYNGINFPSLFIKQSPDKGYVVGVTHTDFYSTHSKGWIIKTDSLGAVPECFYGSSMFTDSVFVLNTTVAYVDSIGITTYTNVFNDINAPIFYGASCTSSVTPPQDTTNTHTDTTVVTTRILTQMLGSKKISIFPNPSSGEFSIQKGSLELKSINVYNIQGENIYEALSLPPNQSTTTINISDRAKGVYVLKVVSNEGTTYSRLVLQ